MVTVTPTNSAVQWGPEAWQLFDYYQHPTRITGGNPLLIMRHASWNSGHYQFYRNSADTEWFYFIRWLLGNQGGSESAAHLATSPAECWDVCAIETGQQKHGNTVTPRSAALYGMDAVADMQRGIASIKAMHRVYNFDPNKVIVGGESAGATLAALSQLVRPRLGSGRSSTGIESLYDPDTFDSTCRGVLYSEGPVDVDMDYFHFSRTGPFLGVSTTDSGEITAMSSRVTDALSVIRYFERNELANYPGMFVNFTRAGNGTKPLGNVATSGSDPHDAIQYTELMAAAATAGAPMSGQLIEATSLVNRLYSGAPDAKFLAFAQPIARWMANQLAVAR
jgi:hypothetical protein